MNSSASSCVYMLSNLDSKFRMLDKYGEEMGELKAVLTYTKSSAVSNSEQFAINKIL